VVQRAAAAACDCGSRQAEQTERMSVAETRLGVAREKWQVVRRAAAAAGGCGSRQAEQTERMSVAETRLGVAREE